MPTIETIAAEVREIKRILLSQRVKRTWCKVSVITELTGWNNQQMYKARENGLVEYRKKNGGFEYLLESINPVFIKK